MKNFITMIPSYWQEILLGAISAAFARVAANLKKERIRRKCLENAICALLRDRIIVIYNRYSEKEYFPIHERENLGHLTEQYYLLGGNGVVKELESKLSSLPTDKVENDRLTSQ